MPLPHALDPFFDTLPRWLWLAVSLVPDLVLIGLVAWLWRSLQRSRASLQHRLGDDGRAIQAVSEVQAQEVFAAERCRLRATLEGMLDPLAIIEPVRDDDHRVVDFSYLDVNPAACNWLRGDRERLVGARLCESLPEVESSGLLRSLAALADNGRPLVLDDFPFMLRGVGLRRLDVRGIRGDAWISLVWRDVTERHDAAEKLATSEEQFRLLAENSTDVILRLDTSDTILWICPSIAPVLGWTPAECIGRDGKEFLATPETRGQYESDKARVLAGQGATSRAQIRDSDGKLHWMEVRSFPYRTSEGIVSGLVASLHLIDAQVRMEEALEHRARIDPLTGLLNRSEFLERLEAAIHRHGPMLGLLWCDIDGFKAINDARGHAAGDTVLAALGERLRGCLRSADDLGGRVGGDEMVVVLHGIAGLDEATTFAETLRRRAAEPIPSADGVIQATMSIGVTLAGIAEGVDTLLARADDAMYEAKERGRNRVVSAEPRAAVTAAS
jgi:diguanylate cyclase (GGDEF)-like protein/PAS domain S-box-containing protein